MRGVYLNLDVQAMIPEQISTAIIPLDEALKGVGVQQIMVSPFAREAMNRTPSSA